MIMAIIKSYTDIEQSKKLAKILPLESADMVIWGRDLDAVAATDAQKFISGLKDRKMNYLACWSLAAMIDNLPRFIEFKGDKYYLRFMKDYVEYANDEVSITGRCLHTTGNNNLVDACYDMILKLYELKML